MPAVMLKISKGLILTRIWKRLPDIRFNRKNNGQKHNGRGIILMDTWLIITKVWFEVVYGTFPDWIEEYISSADIDLFLVCRPDLPWIADPVRENGGEMRQKLFDRYCNEIELHGFSYEIVEGLGEIRVQNALELLKTHRIG